MKKDFLREHRITRLYVRFFDVVLNDAGQPVPNATIQFDTIADIPDGIEVVPTVFIVNDCFRSPECDTKELAQKMLRRILQMCETHGIQNVSEIQIDCDWTKTTQQKYFRFLEELVKSASAQPNSALCTLHSALNFSCTIRLHQLSMPAPFMSGGKPIAPGLSGMLMLYNTGDMTRLDKHKPILDFNDVKPYLKRLKDYPLPLATAYPIYRWELLFRNRKFVDIIHSRDELPILSTDSVVTREPTRDDILQTKRAVEAALKGCHYPHILFDLNNHNIKRYSYDDIEDFLD